VTPADRTLDAGGDALHYLDWAGPGAPVVLAHGGGLTAHTWDGVCARLRDEHRCLALDLRGHGESDWAKEYGIRAHVRDIAALVDAIAPERPVLVGHSLGGLAAITYAAEHGDRLRGLALIDVDVRVAPHQVRSIADFFAGPREFASMDAAVEAARRFNPRRDPAVLRASLRWALAPAEGGGLRWRYDRRAVSTALEEVAQGLAEQRAAVARIACPVLIVWGSLSEVLGRERAHEFAAEFADGTAACVEGAGHTVQGDQPDRLAAVLRPWLAQAAAV
jgi:pimeloyl-ACP methyl ester carboxylesterase